MRKIWFRFRWMIYKVVRGLLFYHEAIRHPILVENRPIAITEGRTHTLARIRFHPQGCTLVFRSLLWKYQDRLEDSWLVLGDFRNRARYDPIYMEEGDTFGPSWNLNYEFLEPENEAVVSVRED